MTSGCLLPMYPHQVFCFSFGIWRLLSSVKVYAGCSSIWSLTVNWIHIYVKQISKQCKEPTHLPLKIPYGHTENNFDNFFMELDFHLGQCHYPLFVEQSYYSDPSYSCSSDDFLPFWSPEIYCHLCCSFSFAGVAFA